MEVSWNEAGFAYCETYPWISFDNLGKIKHDFTQYIVALKTFQNSLVQFTGIAE
jgi:hypothetical protein